MARQPINLGLANSKQGDTPFAAATKINANESELYTNVADTVAKTLANTNGLAAELIRTTTNVEAIAAQALLVTANANAIQANTNSISGFTKTYWFDANDTVTATTPISHVGSASNTYLTNDAIGSGTTFYNPDSKDALWNPSTNKFDFTSLKIGDTVEFRVDLLISNAAAQEVDMIMSLAEASANPYELSLSHIYYKTAGTNTAITALARIYMGDDGTRTGGARFRFASPASSSIRVRGWFYQVTAV